MMVDSTTTKLTLKQFLETIPPNIDKDIAPCISLDPPTNRIPIWSLVLKCPELELYCEECDGSRKFSTSNIALSLEPIVYTTVTFLCNNCRTFHKAFAVRFSLDVKTCRTPSPQHLSPCRCYKLGEYPAFGTRFPSKVLTLFREEKALLLKGKRCEDQGLGVAAFAYYRRMVENQRNKIFKEIIKLKHKGLHPESDTNDIKKLEEACKESQFSKSFELAKDTIPDSLFIDGNNPLALIHSVLSKGLHGRTDEECLAGACVVRTALSYLIEHIASVLKHDEEFSAALTKVNHLNQKL